MGSFLIKCTPGKIGPTIRVLRQQESKLVTTVIEEISLRVVPGIIIGSKDGDFWLSESSARELGRVILFRPEHEHVSRPEVEKEAAVA